MLQGRLDSAGIPHDDVSEKHELVPSPLLFVCSSHATCLMHQVARARGSAFSEDDEAMARRLQVLLYCAVMWLNQRRPQAELDAEEGGPAEAESGTQHPAEPEAYECVPPCLQIGRREKPQSRPMPN